MESYCRNTGYCAAHAYQALRMEDVYNTIIMDLSELKKELLKILLNQESEL